MSSDKWHVDTAQGPWYNGYMNKTQPLTRPAPSAREIVADLLVDHYPTPVDADHAYNVACSPRPPMGHPGQAWAYRR